MYPDEEQPTDSQLESQWETEAMEKDTRMSDRHEKWQRWQRVDVGHVIPAGQPYMFEVEDQTTGDYTVPDDGRDWFVDSSWRPPLELPTEWTLGILRTKHPSHMGSIAQWFHDTQTNVVEGRSRSGLVFIRHSRDYVLDFIPLTPEQVARIEGAR